MKLKLLIGIVTLMLSQSTFAVIYSVGDTRIEDCPGGAHGLWTNNDTPSTYGGTCSNFYSMRAGSMLTIDDSSADQADWTAVLSASAINPGGVIADINLTFSDFAESHTLKVEGGNPDYNGDNAGHDLIDQLAAPGNIDIDFFLTVAGTIEFTPDVTNASTNPIGVVSIVSPYGLQFGVGANAKTQDEFGASSWVQTSDHLGTDHWDLNLTLTSFAGVVPEPYSAALFGAVLVLAGLRRSRREVESR